MSHFKDSWERVKRADMHRKAFAESWNTAIKDEAYTLVAETKDDRTGIVKAVRKIPLTYDLSLELGEFFYQIRAALDCIAYEAAILQPGFDIAPYEEQLYFPLSSSPKKFKNSTFNQIPFPDELGNWVELIQPYNASKTNNTRLHGINKVFGVINDCARKDRHRRLHVVAGHPIELEGFVKAPPPARITYVEGIPCNLLENESEFLRFGFEGACTGDEIEVDGKITLIIAVQEIPVAGPGLDKLLSASQDAVQIVIERFHEFFPG